MKDDQGLEVIFVAPKSAAADAGWKVGDRIVAINGQPVGPDYFDSMYQWSRGEDGTEVRLTTAGGEERTLVLRTYY
jgi:C-terminal processing protease CtpA/Prc